MSKDIDEALNDAEAKPAKKSKADKAEAKPAKKAGKVEAKPAKKAAPAAPAKKSKADKAEAKPSKKAAKDSDATETTSEVKQAILKIKKAISYADFAEKGGFNIRSVRRAARELRDAGHIEIEADGQTKVMKPAV